jgi:hypothetical protein
VVVSSVSKRSRGGGWGWVGFEKIEDMSEHICEAREAIEFISLSLSLSLSLGFGIWLEQDPEPDNIVGVGVFCLFTF